jgi:PBP1b-binding outer membrane lipoprotein LpoB
MKTWTTPIRLGLLLLVAALAVPLGCAEPQYVRDTEKEDIDEYTMSLRFDRKDLDRLYKENIDLLLSSKVTKIWEREAAGGNAPVVAIFPMKNETSEHIGPQLEALLSKFETDLVNKSAANVVSHDTQSELIAEIKRQQSDAYDPTVLARYGRQAGAQYFVTGKVYDSAERVEDERRVQYFMFVKVIEIETGYTMFQNESAITKGLMK